MGWQMGADVLSRWHILMRWKKVTEVVEELGISKDAKILDVGCGSGEILYILKTCGFKNLVGVDIIDQNLKGIKYFKIDINNPEELKKSLKEKFDVVLLIEVIEHVWKPYELLETCYSLLKKGGFLIISTPNLSSYMNLYSMLVYGESYFFTEKDILYYPLGHKFPVPLHTLILYAKNKGFSIEKITGIPERPMPLYSKSFIKRFLKKLLVFVFIWKIIKKQINATRSSY